MIRRLLMTVVITASSLAAQLQFFLLEGEWEGPILTQYNFGPISNGDSLALPFRLRNIGQGPAPLTMLSLEGEGFSLVNPPQLPQTIPEGAALDFSIRFSAAQPGYYTAAFTAEGISVSLYGRVRAATSISVDDNSGGPPRVLPGGDTIDFGTVRLGRTATRRIILTNLTAGKLTVRNVQLDQVTGTTFQLRTPELPVTLEPGLSTQMEVDFVPTAGGIQQAGLEIEQRRFPIRGVGDACAKPGLAVDLPSPQSSQQGKLTVCLHSAVQEAATGEVRIELRPRTPGATDPLIQFLATGNQLVTFTANAGDTAGHFGAQDSAEFQTGTTAGDIVFTATLGDFREQTTVTIVPEAIALDDMWAQRTSAGLDLVINAFDNTHSASKLTFTFYDQQGNTISPGAINVDSSAAFNQFFASSGLGGVFGLHLFFPVNGSAADVDSVEAELLNAVAVKKTGRLRFTTP